MKPHPDHSLLVWYKEVIQPQLDILTQFITADANLDNFNAKTFFKHLLADLELLNLDNMVVENCTERIIEGIETLQKYEINSKEVNLREVAKIALLQSRFDRSLFKSYWSDYLPLMKKHKDLEDTSLVNAYKVQLHIHALVDYISKANQQVQPLENVA